MTGAAPTARVFRLPALAYLVVLLLLFCTAPVALTTTGQDEAPAQISIRTLALLIPVLAAIFIARTATIVSATGITVRAPFGSRRLPWEQVRGLSIDGNTVYAVLADGSVRLPCVRIAHLAELARASGGRVPQLRDPQPKFAPARRRRR